MLIYFKIKSTYTHTVPKKGGVHLIIFIIYKAQYPNILKVLYNKIKSYLLRVKTNINNNKYNCKINFQIKQM